MIGVVLGVGGHRRRDTFLLGKLSSQLPRVGEYATDPLQVEIKHDHCNSFLLLDAEPLARPQRMGAQAHITLISVIIQGRRRTMSLRIMENGLLDRYRPDRPARGSLHSRLAALRL